MALYMKKPRSVIAFFYKKANLFGLFYNRIAYDFCFSYGFVAATLSQKGEKPIC